MSFCGKWDVKIIKRAVRKEWKEGNKSERLRRKEKRDGEQNKKKREREKESTAWSAVCRLVSGTLQRRVADLHTEFLKSTLVFQPSASWKIFLEWSEILRTKKPIRSDERIKSSANISFRGVMLEMLPLYFYRMYNNNFDLSPSGDKYI